jgi:hypothetical protein
MGFLVGYGILSVGAIHSLTTRGAPPTVGVGSRIKVWLRASDHWSESGKIVFMDADSIVVQGWLNGRYARSEIDSLRVKASTGRWAEGWAVGLISGGVVGAGLGSRISRDEYLDAGSPAQNALVWGTVMGISTSTLGSAVGLLLPSRYVTVGTEPGSESRFSVFPTIGKPGLVAHLRF